MDRFLREKMLLGEAAMARLAASHAAVFGLGGVGGWCAEALARAGVGKLTIVDGDSFSRTNINRQLGALESTVGRSKVESTAERLRDIDPELEIFEREGVYSAQNREFFLEPRPDVIIDAIDTVSCKIDLILTAQARGIPIICSLGTGNKLDPSRFRAADLYETSVCPLARVLRNELKKRGVERLRVVYSDETPLVPEALEEPPEGRRSVPGSVSWVPPVAGFILAGEAVKVLVGGFERA